MGAQDAFAAAVQLSTTSLRTEFKDIGNHFPYKGTKDGDQLKNVAEADFKAYAKVAKDEKVDSKGFAKASTDAKTARDDVITFFLGNDKLVAVRSDPLFAAEVPAM